MESNTISKGRSGEEIVCRWLQSRGYKILDRNARVGRYEIDIVAWRAGMLIFCEVRSRWARGSFSPVETIDQRKTGRIRRAAAGWLRTHPNRCPAGMRFDAAAVTLSDGSVEYFDDAF